MKSPLVIIVELLYGLVNGIYQTILFVITKFAELMLSLLTFSRFGIFGFFLAMAIGTIVFLVLAKFIFKNSKSLLLFGIALVVAVAVLVLLWMI